MAILLVAALVAGLGAVVFGCGTAGVGSLNPAFPTTTLGAVAPQPAPAFSGVTLDGKTVSLDQYRGKPLFLVYMTGT